MGKRRQLSSAFVSYSHADAAIVDPLVEMMRLGGRRIFTDRHIAPGSVWRRQIRKAVRESSTFMIFWCCHSAASQEVAAEISLATEAKKPLVPLLLCCQPVPHPLNEHQWIDAGSAVKHGCQDHVQDPGIHRVDASWFERTSPFGTATARLFEPPFTLDNLALGGLIDDAASGELQNKITDYWTREDTFRQNLLHLAEGLSRKDVV